MKSTSHFAMAYLLSAALEKRGVSLDKTAFVCGNIAPDYLPSPRFAPHFAGACYRGIKYTGHRMSRVPIRDEKRVDYRYSCMLGIICHYICDYFCFPHNKEFVGNLKEHVAFEIELDRFLRRNCLDLLDLEGKIPIRVPSSPDGMLERLDSMKEQYRTSGYTFENDLCYAFNACMVCVLSLVYASRCLSRTENPGELDAPWLFWVRSKGSGYIFRMFQYKNRNSDLFFLPELMTPVWG